MNGSDPGGFLTSTVTGSAGAIARGAGGGALSGGFEGALLGASIGALVPGGLIPGGAIGAGLGAAFGSLTGTSKALVGVWDKLINVTKSLIGTFAKFDPLLSMQQERWRRLDEQIGTVWAKTLAPTLKHITDIGIEISQRWTRLKVSVFKSWEGVVNKLITVLGVLVRGVLSLMEFLEKLKNLIGDLLKFALTPLIEGFKALLKWLGFFTSEGGGPAAGGPSWKPGGTPGYGKSSAGGVGGGVPLLRGKFAPDMEMPGWAKGGKMEFGWWKDLKSWLGGYLDKILQALGTEKIGKAVLKVTDPELYRQYEKALRRNKKYPLDQPITEEEVEEYRQEHNLPQKRATSFLGGSVLPGREGMAQRAISVSAFASIPLDPKIYLGAEKETEVGRSGRELDRLMQQWEESGELALPAGLLEATERYRKAREAEKAEEIKEPKERERRPRKRQPKSRRLRERHPRKRYPRERHPRRPGEPETPEISEEEIEEEIEEESVAETIAAKETVEAPSGNIIMQVLDSNQLLDLLSFSWEEIRNVLRAQQAEYTLLRYRMQTEGTYL